MYQKSSNPFFETLTNTYTLIGKLKYMEKYKSLIETPKTS